MAKEGLRVLALATKRVDAVDVKPYQDLIFLGLVGMQDPPREDVRQAIEKCHQAGVRVVMVTGDQPVTAGNIARAVGLVDVAEPKIVHGRDLKSPAELNAQE